MPDSPHSFELLAAQFARAAVVELLPALLQGGMPVVPEWLSPKQAAVYSGFTERGLQQFRESKEGPPYHRPNGRSIRYRRADIDAWMEAGLVEPGGTR